MREKAAIDQDYSKQIKKLISKFEKGGIDESLTTDTAFRIGNN